MYNTQLLTKHNQQIWSERQHLNKPLPNEIVNEKEKHRTKHFKEKLLLIMNHNQISQNVYLMNPWVGEW